MAHDAGRCSSLHPPGPTKRSAPALLLRDRGREQEPAIETMMFADQFAAQPKHRIVFDHWSALRTARGGGLPRRGDLDPCAFISCLADLMLLKVLREGEDYRYDLVGENIRDRYGVAYAGRSLRDIAFRGHEVLLAEYRAAVRSGTPFYVERRQISERSFIDAMIGKLILPLSGEGGTIDDLLVCLAAIG